MGLALGGLNTGRPDALPGFGGGPQLSLAIANNEKPQYEAPVMKRGGEFDAHVEQMEQAYGPRGGRGPPQEDP